MFIQCGWFAEFYRTHFKKHMVAAKFSIRDTENITIITIKYYY